MRKLSCLIITSAILMYAAELHAQDSLKTVSKSPSEIGFSFSLNYSVMDFTSQPYFADSSGRLGRSNVENSGGLALGVFYNFYAGKNCIIRPAAEINIMPAKIYYDTDINYRSYSEVFPVCIELPIMAIFSLNPKFEDISGSRKRPELGIGVRPVFPLQTFSDMKPSLQTYNINADLSLGMPVRLGKIRSRIEVFFSYGFRNLIGTDESDFKTYTIDHIGRSYAGLRLMLF